MAGPTTAVLDDDIKELKTSIQRIVDAVHLLEVTMTQRFAHAESETERRFSRMESETERRFGQAEKQTEQRFGKLESDMERRFGQVEKQMVEGFGGVRGDIKSLNRATNGILAVALLVLGSLGGAIWYFAKLDSRVGQLERNTKIEGRP
jgi:hypothetical protein